MLEVWRIKRIEVKGIPNIGAQTPTLDNSGGTTLGVGDPFPPLETLETTKEK